MASKFYIKTFDSVIYELSATTDINVAITSKASSNPVENGQTLTDNIVVGNDTLSMSGRLTDIIQRGDSRAKTPFEFITELETRIGFKEVFTVYYSDSLIPKINCSIDSFSFSKTKSLGGESWNCSFNFKQLRFVDQSGVAAIPVSALVPLLSQKEETDQTTEKVKEWPDLEKAHCGAAPPKDDLDFVTYEQCVLDFRAIKRKEQRENNEGR